MHGRRRRQRIFSTAAAVSAAKAGALQTTAGAGAEPEARAEGSQEAACRGRLGRRRFRGVGGVRRRRAERGGARVVTPRLPVAGADSEAAAPTRGRAVARGSNRGAGNAGDYLAFGAGANALSVHVAPRRRGRRGRERFVSALRRELRIRKRRKRRAHPPQLFEPELLARIPRPPNNTVVVHHFVHARDTRLRRHPRDRMPAPVESPERVTRFALAPVTVRPTVHGYLELASSPPLALSLAPRSSPSSSSA